MHLELSTCSGLWHTLRRKLALNNGVYRKQFFARSSVVYEPILKPLNYGFFSEFYTRPYYRNSDYPPGGM